MKLLLLVHSESDVAHLDGAARAILASAITGVWVVFSPSITVKASEVTTKLDAEIAQLRQAEQQAATRTDYKTAEEYKAQRQGKELDRQKALQDAWKTAPEADRKARVQAIFEPFSKTLRGKAGLNAKITAHSDHYDREQWIAMLNSLSGVWFKEMVPGSFIVGWPESVETLVSDIPNKVPVPKNRAEELATMKHFSLVGVAKKLGIETEGKIKNTLIEEILASEGKPEAALNEY